MLLCAAMDVGSGHVKGHLGRHRPHRIRQPACALHGRQPGKLWAKGLAPEDGSQLPASDMEADLGCFTPHPSCMFTLYE